MIATLPMYDWPEIRPETDLFWHALADRLGVGFALDRSIEHDASWRRPDLLFSQTCGYPLTHEFRGKLKYVATPHYDVDGCDGPNYCSMIFMRTGHKTGGPLRAAINSPDSMSGMLALRLAGPPIASKVLSGSHVRSLEMVASGEADVCAIDAVCVALARRYRPYLLDGLVEVARSPMVPGLPFITQAGVAEEVRAVMLSAMTDPELQHVRNSMMLTGASNVGLAAYDRIVSLEQAIHALE
jgi:ABC-type phosphate/phosphonate transport system substrate-binding protein